MPALWGRLRRRLNASLLKRSVEETRADFARDLVLALAALAAILFAGWRFGFEKIFTPGWWRP